MINSKKLLVISLLAIPAISYASLGDDVSSITTDNNALASSISLVTTRSNVSSNASYQTSTIKTPDNFTIKEFSANGKVFAVSWQGKSYPNFKQIFGSYFPQLKTASASNSGLTRSKLTGNDFISYSSGVPGLLSGIAYVPSLVPNSLNINTLK